MRKEIRINPNGGQVLTNVKIEGLVAAGYFLQFFEANSHNVIASFSGHNEYDDDDLRPLPNSAKSNIGRVIMLDTTIAKIDDTSEERSCKISLEIFQNGQLVDAAIQVVPLNNEVTKSLILVKIVAL